MTDERDGLRLAIPAMNFAPHDRHKFVILLSSRLIPPFPPASKRLLTIIERATPPIASCGGMADLSREEFPPLKKPGVIRVIGYDARRRLVLCCVSARPVRPHESAPFPEFFCSELSYSLSSPSTIYRYNNPRFSLTIF